MEYIWPFLWLFKKRWVFWPFCVSSWGLCDEVCRFLPAQLCLLRVWLKWRRWVGTSPCCRFSVLAKLPFFPVSLPPRPPLFPWHFIPNIYFYMHQVSIVHIYLSVSRDGYIAAYTLSLSQPGWLNKMHVAWSCHLQKNLLSRCVWSQQRVLTKNGREFWQLEPPLEQEP